MRWIPPPPGETEGAFVYDYFIKDHLGSIRMVLTEQTKEDTYAATMEPQNATVENQLFDNISSTTVAKPTGFDNDPNNKQVSQLDGSDGNNNLPRVGPAIVLKVMAGDTITIATQAWYQGAVEPPPSGALPLLNDLLNALTGGVITNSHGIYNTTDNDPNTVLSSDLSNFFTSDENSHYSAAAPKAFLNYVAFDNQLNEVSANSGVVQVPTITGSEQAQPLVAPEQIIQKDGYLYIYVSNESAQKLFFDNLVIHHAHGPLLAETNYYPDGLTMAGISDQAMLEPGSRFKYQSKELDTALAVDLYDFGARYYDEQIGRFNQLDPASQFASGYEGMGDEWVSGTDPDGQWFLIDDLVAMGVGGGLNLLNAALSGKVHNFWSGLKYFGAGALGAEAGLYLGPVAGFAVGGTLNVLADYSEGHIQGANLGQTLLNSAFSFVSGGGSAYMGAEAGIVKAQQILFNRALKTATATTLTAAQSIQPLDGQVGFQDATTDASVPQQVAGPEDDLLNSTETGNAGVFENPNGGMEPTLSFKTEGSATNTESSFFEGTKYSDKVLSQMKKGDFHSFPEDVKTFEGNGVITTIKGNDGVIRQILKIPGKYKGEQGFFEFIKEADGTINHRFFHPIP